ncbi:MAG TPA: hypothetical protein EYH23_00255 [Euryarchaeota archaeon]|nr:hypothetical protein [Euryarchaeota archaeon]HIQ09940.1 hypothetical protein [Euryarchaeota archaeon]
MRGFLLTFEALLSLLVLTVFLLEFFIPLPNTASLVRFIELNDRFTASLEANAAPPFPEYLPGMECVAIRYLPRAHATQITVVPVCLR